MRNMTRFALSLLGLFVLVLLVSASQTEDLLRLLLSRSTGKLAIQTLDTANLQATYSRKINHKVFDAQIETVEGVRIESEVNNNIERVKIQNLDGKEIVSFHHLANSKDKATLFNIMGQNFVATKDKNGNRKEYHVPEVFSEGISQIFSEGEFDPGYLKLLDSRGANAVRIAAIQEMLTGQNIPLMREAVEAIGQRGIIGRDNPPVLPAMMMVMRFSALRDNQKKAKEATSQWWPWEFKIISDPKDCTLESNQIKCPGNGACCEEDRCPSSEETDCNGMCGYGCGCWKWTCGDCCVHKGCLGHDECCRKDQSMWNTGCLFPYGFQCDKPYEC